MTQYYYTVASLPAVRFEETPFLTTDEFLEICRIETTPEDQRIIEMARILPDSEGASDGRSDGGGTPPPESEVLRQWDLMVRDFRHHAGQIRAQNLGRDADRIPRSEGIDSTMAERTRAVLNEDNPLRMEYALMRWLWQLADNLETGHHFDREKLVVYHLKLQLAARRARISDSERGGKEFDRQYEVVAQSLMEIAT